MQILVSTPLVVSVGLVDIFHSPHLCALGVIGIERVSRWMGWLGMVELLKLDKQVLDSQPVAIQVASYILDHSDQKWDV